ncbi:MAG: hypothetical protein RL268_965, partial [Pseudomonadota bacterium]
MAVRRLESVVSKSQGATGHSGPSRWSTLMRHRLLVDVARSMAPTVVGFMGLGVASALVAPAAQAAIPTLQPGDKVYNPITRTVETVTQVIAPASVATDAGWVILLAQSVGDRFTISGGRTSYTFEVTAITTTKVGTVDVVTAVTLKNLTTNTSQVVATAQPLSGDGSSGSGANTIPFTPPSGSENTIYEVKKGGDGGNGRDGAIFVPATSGGDGATGPTIDKVVVGPLSITAVPNSPAGIYVASIGGDGGDGGSSYLNLAGGGKPGGAAGAGGTVNLSVGSGVTISTSGNQVYGIFAQSAAGTGGSGGSGYATTGGGGSGGDASQGGTVTLSSNAIINTTGNNAAGILAQSVGGSGGSGGSSYVSVSSGGGGSYGGNGGSVAVTHGGTVQTSGSFAYGVLAQSIGGTGGNAGSSILT